MTNLLASFSPDVRWVAYVSNQRGADEVYAQRFILGQAAGGAEPRWRRNGREIYCRNAGGLYRMEWSIGLRRYGQDVTPDWSQFVFAEPDLEEQRKPMTVVLNWPLLLKK